MLRWLKRLYARFSRQLSLIEPAFSCNNGENLTAYEKALLGDSEDPKCPDCRGELLPGPCGGLSQNFMCAQCQAKFNLCFWNESWTFCERISNRRVVLEGVT